MMRRYKSVSRSLAIAMATRPETQRRASRHQRVTRAIHRTLSEAIVRNVVWEPQLEGFAPVISEVKVTGDYSRATIYLEPLPPLQSNRLIAALNRHAGRLRQFLATTLNMRSTPELRFHIDDRYAAAQSVDAVLTRIRSGQTDTPTDASALD